MRAKGMIHVAAIEAARTALANQGAALVSQMEVFLPALWPPHRYDQLVAPNGAFEESTIDRSAPNYPGLDVRVPHWTDVGPSYGFGQSEENKMGNFQLWLFSRKEVNWLMGYFGFSPGNVFRKFTGRSDREFPDGKFPRDEWKSGSIDLELWESSRRAVASAASQIMMEIDRVNQENLDAGITARGWLMSKFVEGPVIGENGQPTGDEDSTFAEMPEIMEDIEDWHSKPAYQRVAQFLQDSDATWTGAGHAFAWSASFYQQMFLRLSSGAFAADYFDQCFTLWRTGSQTRRRDQYE